MPKKISNIVNKDEDKYEKFISRNQSAKIESFKEGDNIKSKVVSAWGDSSFELIDSGNNELSEALENLYLPPRLSAILHEDTNRLEIFWTAYDVSNALKEVIGRKFEYSFKGQNHTCEFAPSSERALILAKHFRPLRYSQTEFRNLLSFSNYAKNNDETRKKIGLQEPKSFFISNYKLKDKEEVEFITHLNFFLSYYDERSPLILLHELPDEDQSSKSRTRYIVGDFPKIIEAPILDNNMLTFWHSANGGNAMMRYLLYYRIIEYAATNFVQNECRNDILKIMADPRLKQNTHTSIEKILGAVSKSKLEEVPKMKLLLKSCVDAKLVWQEIEQDRKFFEKDTKFDGGFSIPQLINPSHNEKSWCQNGTDDIVDRIRKIRNALSHGKDIGSDGVIIPTPKNFRLMIPWVNLISIAAGEIILYKNVT